MFISKMVLGRREDVNRLQGMDLLLQPSVFEGLE